ncbi:aspartyl-phosphate phosphatase Spo0E family protein [Tissierella praeacuta]|uniref:aspartyl-phosphate phosphatase Spo0E family protein n=1 Tax=Tissierella praeacuta TaxID=43131 RepID=UPI001C0FF965|nr:aspartyl-phosphate phosphatase Spo0E family protein [Tissierella praeacuta]MBU5256531.1 aspartyl-phosphate phosphatase Spo0E family protein [Tissierella praeacuta]
MTVRKNEVEELRELLHKAIKNDEYKEILKISKELDELIIKYIKSENRIEEKSYDI